MTWRRPLTLVLLVLLAVVQGQLWLGKGGVLRDARLRAQVDEVSTRNAAAKAVNDRLAAEVSDLKGGLEMIEEKARNELGMVRPNEILVQYDLHANPPAAAAASVPASP
jgi:cell division protein FtsB